MRLKSITPYTLALVVSLPGTFAAAATALPTCPAGTNAVGKAPPEGLEWRCATASGVPEGPWLTWYEGGQLMSERHMKKGREHGRQRSWWPNGQLMMEGVSVDGNRYHGFKYWSIDGTPAQFDVKTEKVELKDKSPPSRVLSTD